MKNAEYYKESSTLVNQDNTLVLRLERNQKDVKQLRNQLNSYCCEPQTYYLFERIETLKKGLESLSNTNKEIITTIKEHKASAKEYLEGVKQQFLEFRKLQSGVEEYLGLIQNKYTPI